MWKRLIAAETPEETQAEVPICISSPTDPITAICEEEEEQVSKEEESAAEGDEREEVLTIEEEEEEILPQQEPLGESEEEPK